MPKPWGINMLMGREFSEEFKSDTAAIIINKAGLDLMNLEDPFGSSIRPLGRQKNTDWCHG